ncbi:MAG: DUF4157 domain-containing protein [Myxococcales bacterium]|nr:DUF4157 domain-containing protein [Myxococcales bacterium]
MFESYESTEVQQVEPREYEPVASQRTSQSAAKGTANRGAAVFQHGAAQKAMSEYISQTMGEILHGGHDPKSEGKEGPRGDASKSSGENASVMRSASGSGIRIDKSPEALAQEGVQGGSSSSLPYRSQLERSFGRDLSHIPVRTGESATSAARSIGANAYAYQGSIVLGDKSDFRTVAEETAHVLQMERRGGGREGVAAPTSAVEVEAQSAADRASSGQPVGALSEGLGHDSVARNQAPAEEPKEEPIVKEEKTKGITGWFKRNKAAILKTAIKTGLMVGFGALTGGIGLVAIPVTALMGAAVSVAVDAAAAGLQDQEYTAKDMAVSAVIGGVSSGLATGAEHVIAGLAGIGHGAAEGATHGATHAASHGATHGGTEAVAHGAGTAAHVGLKAAEGTVHAGSEVGMEAIEHKIMPHKHGGEEHAGGGHETKAPGQEGGKKEKPDALFAAQRGAMDAAAKGSAQGTAAPQAAAAEKQSEEQGKQIFQQKLAAFRAQRDAMSSVGGGRAPGGFRPGPDNNSM